MAFTPFDRRDALETTRRNLPHWQQPGATYFVTFRLADSLPAEARCRLHELRQLNDAEAFAWIDRYLDAGTGGSVLAQPNHATVVEASLHHVDGSRYLLGAFAIMPNHVHALVQPLDDASLTQIVHSWKSYTAHRFQRSGRLQGQVWQEESFDRIVRDENELRRFHQYILSNPVEAHLAPGTFISGVGSGSTFGIT